MIAKDLKKGDVFTLLPPSDTREKNRMFVCTSSYPCMVARNDEINCQICIACDTAVYIRGESSKKGGTKRTVKGLLTDNSFAYKTYKKNHDDFLALLKSTYNAKRIDVVKSGLSSSICSMLKLAYEIGSCEAHMKEIEGINKFLDGNNEI